MSPSWGDSGCDKFLTTSGATRKCTTKWLDYGVLNSTLSVEAPSIQDGLPGGLMVSKKVLETIDLGDASRSWGRSARQNAGWQTRRLTSPILCQDYREKMWTRGYSERTQEFPSGGR